MVADAPSASPAAPVVARPARQVALVTGASRGLGPEVARQLAVRGWRVIATARDAKDTVALAQAIDGESRPLDVSDASSIAALARGLAQDGVRLDLLVNNAGIALTGFDAAVVRRTLDVNYRGALAVTRALLPLVNDGGAVTMVSSGMGELDVYAPPLRERFLAVAAVADADVLAAEFEALVGAGTHRAAGWPSSAYRVSKAAMNAATRALAKELAPRRIRVNAVCPGWVATDLGGKRAPRDIPTGARSIVATALAPETGGFFRDGHAIDW